MAISINHLTYVISIPKSDTVYVDTNAVTGYEIREYDEYALMRELADYLDSEAGIALPPAFEHATQVTISGVVYARSLSFLAPYTITFETGAYQVQLIGGTNNNMLDVLNPNNVSVISANSAGLQTVATGGGGGLTTEQANRLTRIEKWLRNKKITDPVAGKQTVYDDDGTTILGQGDLFEDAAGTQAYRGQGAERAERLA